MFESSQPITTLSMTIEQLTGWQDWQRPVLFKGLVSHWPMVESALAGQAVEYLQRFPSPNQFNAVIADPNSNGRFFYNQDMTGFNFTRRQASFAEVLAQLDYLANNAFAQKPCIYLGSTSVERCLPGFREKNDLPLADREPLVSAWLGNQSRVAAHFDAVDNIACVAVGRRRFTLFPPEQVKNLYVGPSDFTPAGQAISLVDFHQPDFAKFPKFAEAQKHAIVVEMQPGDALFIPAMWWHHVEALEDINLLINYWWRSTPRYLGEPMDAFRHALLSLKSLPAHQRKAWQSLFEHYVFNDGDVSHIPSDKQGEVGDIDQEVARRLRGLLINKLNR